MTATLDDRTVQTLAKQLYDARKSRTQLRHFSRQYPSMTIDDGYAIQRAWVKLEQADGHTVVGRKIGLTSRAMQQASQIDEPDFAPLMSDMVFSPAATSQSTASSRRASRWSWRSSSASR